MSKFTVSENVVEIERYLRRVDHIIRKKGREILKDFEITVPQFSALQWLINDGNLTIGELSQKMSLACSTITDLVDRMEKGQLVIRERDEQDKRVVRIKVKEKGHVLVEKVLEKRREYLTEQLKGLKENDMLSLKENLKALYDAMTEENGREE